jgi:exodeoxyribonuclease VII large subunit
MPFGHSVRGRDRGKFLGMTAGTNVAELTVSELSFALKRIIEEDFAHVRVRAEIGRVSRPSSGHLYLDLKDERACLAGVVWKTSVAGLKIRPEQGLEVVCTGRLTTFPGQSKYQIVIESMEPAGLGALMALLEERRRKLAAEGLFEEARKKPIPFLPRVIGVVTSPSGSVIRDILHRLGDRFPRHVLVWPVRVQGETCAREVAAAIRGFNALDGRGAIPRPELLIVARGGGSLEDLWSFNEEIVVRAAAESAIPLISAVGHETDTTLIDLAADLRAPTPTAAAERAVPVRSELLSRLGDLSRRREGALARHHSERRMRLRSAVRALPRPDDLLSFARQRFDASLERLRASFARDLAARRARLDRCAVRLHPRLLGGAVEQRRLLLARAHGGLVAAQRRALADHRSLVRRKADRLRPRLLETGIAERKRLLSATHERGARALAAGLRLERARLRETSRRLAPGLIARPLRPARQQLDSIGSRLAASFMRRTERDAVRLARTADLLRALSYQGVLERGFALVRDASGQPVRRAASIKPGQALRLEFADGEALAEAQGGAKRASSSRPKPHTQGQLFDEETA